MVVSNSINSRTLLVRLIGVNDLHIRFKVIELVQDVVEVGKVITKNVNS